MPRIALVTARAARDLDTDLAPLAEALVAAGATPTVACWDDNRFPWHEADAAVLRSAWDYPQRIDSFIAWVDATASSTHLLNTPATVHWNADKRYLGDLAARGVPVVPTTFVAPGESLDVLPDSEIVVKPAVSAGSKDTARFGPGDPASVALAERIMATGRTAVIQPYQSGVDSEGETALVWFDGAFSHAFSKGPILRRGAAPTDDLYAEEEIGACTPTGQQVEAAGLAIRAATDAVGGVPVYARVDLVPGSEGQPLLLELELIEPSVYHHVDRRSAERFALAILDRVDAR